MQKDECPGNLAAMRKGPKDCSLSRVALLLITLILVLSGRVASAEVDCLTCHGDLAKKKTVHAAVSMGCATCHTGIDASDIPHKKTNKVPKGLSSDMPDLCYGCHDKGLFTKKTVHAAVLMGCTSCHNPHATDTPKLLTSDLPGSCFTCHDKKKFEGSAVHAPVAGGMCTSCHNPHSQDRVKLLLSEPPDLCFTCHDKAGFAKKNIHAPVAGGMCSSCHDPHASGHKAQLLKDVNDVCMICHDRSDIKNGMHVIRGFRAAGHPVKAKKDPKKPDAEFTCASCHNPHSSEWPKLFQYKAQVSFDLCIHCHQK